MAVIKTTRNDLFFGNGLFTWQPMALGDTGEPVGSTSSGDRTVQVEGVFGANGQVNIEGTLDGNNWRQLHDPFGNLLMLTSPGIAAVMENVDQIRPNVANGDGTTAVFVTLAVRKRNG